MIILRDISLRRGSKLLFEDAGITVQPGQRLALIGANGCGKSSLFALLLGELGADSGDIEGLATLRVAHMAQETEACDDSATEYVLGGDEQLAELRDGISQTESEGNFDRAAELHSRLEEIDGYSAERRSQRLLEGLGFGTDDLWRPVREFSGGWRIRLNLARALMTPSDLLLLDEPTNHLDLDATLWLQQWLQAYPGTLLMISHDRDFIDATCERVLQIEHQQLVAYKGNYSAFEQQRAERLANQQATFDKQQRRIAEIDDFVRRFRYKATKARQAQSRLKELERMQRVAPAHLDSPFDFSFPAPSGQSDPLLRLDGAELGYPGKVVLSGVDLVLRPGSRIGLLGRNGAGKSTLLKSLVGDLPLMRGERSEGQHCKIGYFDQQQLEALDLSASPALHIQRLRPGVREQEVLDFLGSFNFHGETATAAVGPLSGGEKARLALAMVAWQRPNLLVMDEPTNHLDLEMCSAIELALQSFDGALVLVSHDRHLLRNTVDELVLVHDGRADMYGDDLAGYEQWVLGTCQAQDKGAKAPPAESRKKQRQEAAANRDRLRPLKQALQKTEAEMAQTEQRLESVQQRLSDTTLYDEGCKEELADLLREEGELQRRSGELDERWLEQQQALEQLV